MLKFRDRKKGAQRHSMELSALESKKNWKNFYHANIEIGYP